MPEERTRIWAYKPTARRFAVFAKAIGKSHDEALNFLMDKNDERKLSFNELLSEFFKNNGLLTPKDNDDDL